MSNTEESATNREAHELAEQLEALGPKVRQAVAYADDALSMRVARAAQLLADTANTVVSAGVAMGGD